MRVTLVVTATVVAARDVCFHSYGSPDEVGDGGDDSIGGVGESLNTNSGSAVLSQISNRPL